MSNKVLISNEQNAVKVPSGLRILIRRSCNAVLNYEKFEGSAEISVIFVDNERIRALNKQYRNKDTATDVLSFPLGENGQYDIDEDNGCKLLGDIVISMERAMEQAELYGHTLQREVAYLTVHSMLHLLGYDHEASGLEAVRMREKEEAVLLQLGLPRTVSYTNDEILHELRYAPIWPVSAAVLSMPGTASAPHCGKKETSVSICALRFMPMRPLTSPGLTQPAWRCCPCAFLRSSQWNS